MPRKWEEGFNIPEPKRLQPILTRATSWDDIFPLTGRYLKGRYKTQEAKDKARERLRSAALDRFSSIAELEINRLPTTGRVIVDEMLKEPKRGYVLKETTDTRSHFYYNLSPDGNISFQLSHASAEETILWADYIPCHTGDINHDYTRSGIDALLQAFTREVSDYKIRLNTRRFKSDDLALEQYHEQEARRISRRIKVISRHLKGYFATETNEKNMIAIMGSRPRRIDYLLFDNNTLLLAQHISAGHILPDNL